MRIMVEIKCSKCNQKLKFTECVSKNKDRKRIMLHFPCCHYSYIVYNVPISMDNNTIIKDFKSIIKDDLTRTWDVSSAGDRYLN